MMVMMTCSLIVNGPGLSETPKTVTFGMKRAHNLQTGKVNSWGTIFYGQYLIQQTGYNRFKQRWKTNRGNCDGRISEVKELVGTRDENSPNETDDPGAEGRTRHRGIIGIGNRGPDFGIWGFIFKRECRRVEIGVVEVVDNNVLRASR